MRSTVLSEAEDEIANGFGEFLFRLRVAPRTDAGWAMDGPPSKETKSSPNHSWNFLDPRFVPEDDAGGSRGRDEICR